MPSLSRDAVNLLVKRASRHFSDVLYVEQTQQIWVSSAVGTCICWFDLRHLEDDLIVYRWHERVEDVEIMRVLRTLVGPLVMAGNPRILTDLSAVKRSLNGLNPLIKRDVIPQAERHGLRQVALVVDPSLRNHLPDRYFKAQQFGEVRVRYFTTLPDAQSWAREASSPGDVVPPIGTIGAGLLSRI
jgi:hypothetical protein